MCDRGRWPLAGRDRNRAGQTPEDLAQQGIRSFRRAEFEAAAALFRRALELPPRDTVGLQRRIQILDYLAAAELFRGKRDTAVVVFRRVVQAEPRHRVDEVVFPPEVSSLLDDVRRATKVIAVSIPADTILPLGGGTWSVRLLGTSFQTAIATVTTDNAIPIRELYSGPLDDSLTVRWNGTDSFGRAVNSGPYELSVVSMSAGRRTRLLRVPLKITNITPDTIPIPASIPDSLLLPERVNGRRAFGALLGGAALGAATSILPLIVSKGARPTPVRFMVGGAVGLAGHSSALPSTHRAGPSSRISRQTDCAETPWRRRCSERGRKTRAAEPSQARASRRARRPHRLGSPVKRLPVWLFLVTLGATFGSRPAFGQAARYYLGAGVGLMRLQGTVSSPGILQGPIESAMGRVSAWRFDLDLGYGEGTLKDHQGKRSVPRPGRGHRDDRCPARAMAFVQVRPPRSGVRAERDHGALALLGRTSPVRRVRGRPGDPRLPGGRHSGQRHDTECNRSVWQQPRRRGRPDRTHSPDTGLAAAGVRGERSRLASATPLDAIERIIFG